LLGRREFLIGAGVVAVAVAGVVPAVILTRAGGKNAAPPLAPPDALARIEETTNQVTHVVPDLPVTRAVTSGEGAVWVLSNVASVVLRVDPETLAVTSQGVPGNPTSIAAGAGAIWVTTTFEGVGYLLVLDPRHPGSAQRRIPLSYSEPRGIVVGNSSVWVLAYNPLQDHTALLRFPPASELPGETAEPLSEVAVPGHPLPSYVGTWLVAESSDIWLLAAAPGPGSTASGSDSVYRLNERTPSMIERIATIPLAESLAVGAGSVWVTSQAEPRSVFRVDPAGGSIIREPLGVRDTGPLVVSHGSLWIGDFLDGTVGRTDPSSGETTVTIRVSEPVAAGVGGPTYTSLEGAHMNGLAADATAVWALTSSAIEVS
jgi:streptogramin lyase